MREKKVSSVRSFSLSWGRGEKKSANRNNISGDNSFPFPEGKKEKPNHLPTSFILGKYLSDCLCCQFEVFSHFSVSLKSDINTRCIRRHVKHPRSPVYLYPHAGGCGVGRKAACLTPHSLLGWRWLRGACSSWHILLILHNSGAVLNAQPVPAASPRGPWGWDERERSEAAPSSPVPPCFFFPPTPQKLKHPE